MMMPDRRPAAFIAAVTLAVSIAMPVHAAEQMRVSGAPCVDAVERAGGPGRGITTAEPASAVVVRLCDGAWRQLTLEEDVVVLVEAEDVVAPTRSPDGDGPVPVPDGDVTSTPDGGLTAWLTGPTGIYRHGILGDAIEATGFRVVRSDGAAFDYKLDDDAVFEDRRVRLIDVTGDGEDELIVVRADLDRGAALAVYGLTGRRIELLAATPPIGQAHRWLNPAAVADFDGDGRVEIAYVETPHIGGVLTILGLGVAGLTVEASAFGYSNHAIGSRVLDVAAVVDWTGDGVADIALPDSSRRELRVATMAGGRIGGFLAVIHKARIATAIVATDLNGDGPAELVYGLEDGTLVVLKR